MHCFNDQIGLISIHLNRSGWSYFLSASRGGRTRTADPRVPNAVRYQLRYTPAARV
jgi:hypothetical protein